MASQCLQAPDLLQSGDDPLSFPPSTDVGLRPLQIWHAEWDPRPRRGSDSRQVRDYPPTPRPPGTDGGSGVGTERDVKESRYVSRAPGCGSSGEGSHGHRHGRRLGARTRRPGRPGMNERFFPRDVRSRRVSVAPSRFLPPGVGGLRGVEHSSSGVRAHGARGPTGPQTTPRRTLRLPRPSLCPPAPVYLRSPRSSLNPSTLTPPSRPPVPPDVSLSGGGSRDGPRHGPRV